MILLSHVRMLAEQQFDPLHLLNPGHAIFA
jgi:hypothetical protein